MAKKTNQPVKTEASKTASKPATPKTDPVKEAQAKAAAAEKALKELSQKHEELKKAHANLQDESSEKDQVISEMEAAIENKGKDFESAGKKILKGLKNGKEVTVEMLHPTLKYKKEIYDFAKLKANKEIVNELLEIGYGGFKIVK